MWMPATHPGMTITKLIALVPPFSAGARGGKRMGQERPSRLREGVPAMAMTMNGEYELAVPPQTVWEKLAEAATLQPRIPGCGRLGQTPGAELPAGATIQAAPVR